MLQMSSSFETWFILRLLLFPYLHLAGFWVAVNMMKDASCERQTNTKMWTQ